MQIQIDRRKKELKTHGTYEFPVLVSFESLDSFETRTFQWHWHTEMEWIYVEQGEIFLQVNEQGYHLKEGEGIFCNSNMMHSGGPINEENCRYVSVTVHPRFLTGYENSFLQKKYAMSSSEAETLASFALKKEISWQAEILKKLKEITGYYYSGREDFDYCIYILFLEIWLQVWTNRKDSMQPVRKGKEQMRLKEILSYLHQHYQEKITLKDIAGKVNICEEECCRFFKKYMKQSIFDYLMDYRIDQSLSLLEMEFSITEIGGACGFNSPAYYTKIFRERMGCSPREYRKRIKEEKKCLK